MGGTFDKLSSFGGDIAQSVKENDNSGLSGGQLATKVGMGSLFGGLKGAQPAPLPMGGMGTNFPIPQAPSLNMQQGTDTMFDRVADPLNPQRKRNAFYGG